MASPQEIKNQLAQKAQAPVQQGSSFQSQLATQFKNQFKTIQSIVPKHVTPERLVRIGMNATSRNPKLLECTPDSIVGAVVNCGVLGVEPNLLGQAYIVPFWNSSTNQFEAQFQLGYKGLIDLARRTGQLSNVYSHEVYEGDEFRYSYGLEKDLIHVPSGEEDESKITHFYAVYKMKDGSYDFIVMSRHQIEKHRDRFTKSQKNGNVFGPWKDHFAEMAKKTVLIKLLKTAPISIEQQETQTIMEGLQRDNSISQVQHNEAIGDAFIQSDYHVVNEEEEQPLEQSQGNEHV
ncbi:recombinase RecT [Priestia flexa]|uniref:recombinase RecT n=1 Tax=Priestia flexa TaxID=86664 RepID=UPI003D266457